MGFYDTENLYQVYDIEKAQLVKERDVIFHEYVLGYSQLERDKPQIGWDIMGEWTNPTEEDEGREA